MEILIALLLIFFAFSAGLLWTVLYIRSAVRRRRFPEREAPPPMDKRIFLAAAVPGALLGFVVLPVELLVMQSVFDVELTDGAGVFLILFLISFLTAVHAYAWGVVNVRRTPRSLHPWRKMGIISVLVLGAPLLVNMLLVFLAQFVHASIHLVWIVAFVLLPGFLLLTAKGRSMGFPDPASHSKLRAFFLPFLLGAYAGFVCGFLEVAILLAASGTGGVETGAAAALLYTIVIIASAVGIINGIWWGRLNLRRATQADLQWRVFARSLILTLLLPAGIAVIGIAVAIFAFSIMHLWVLWLVAFGFAALMGIAYWLLKASKGPVGEKPAEPRLLQASQRVEKPHGGPVKVPSTPDSADEGRIFAKTLVSVAILVIVVSAAFGFGARLAIQHWAQNPGGGGWIDLGGMMEVMVLWGMQIAATVLCFLGGFTIAGVLSTSGGVRITYSLPYGAVLGLIAVVANFIIDAIAVMALMMAHGLP
jgi:hypothetical protein